MTDLNVLARNVEQLSSTVATKFASVDKTMEALNDRLGNIVIPAVSRRAGIVAPLGRSLSSEADAVAGQYAAISRFVRSGDDSAFEAIGGDGMTFSATNSVGSDPDGGYLVVPVLSTAINKRVFDVSPLARLARRVTIETGDAFEEPIDADDIDAGWVSEREDRPPLDTAKLKGIRVPVHEVYTNQPVTQRLLDDSRFDIGAWLEGKISDKFSRTEGAAFVSGDGIEKPWGLLSRATSSLADGERDFFTIQHINSGVGGGFALTDVEAGVSPADVLVDTVYSLRAPYRQNARWLMNMKTAGIVRKMKDGEGRFIWQEAISEGQPPLLLGFPVEFDEEMPDIDAASLSIAFGDFEKAYVVVEKPGIRLLRDPYTAKPHVLFYAYRRVGGGVQNGEAVKLVRFAAAG